MRNVNKAWGFTPVTLAHGGLRLKNGGHETSLVYVEFQARANKQADRHTYL